MHKANAVRLIDTHCHLDDPAFTGDLDDVLRSSSNVGVATWINVGYSPERWKTTIELASHRRGVAAALGLHPSESRRWTAELHREMVGLIQSSRARAIGETGIDLFRGEDNLDQQRIAFEAQLAIAVELELPVVVHMRAAEQHVLETLTHASVLPRLLFHSFDGGPNLVKFILETGSFVGVGGLATRPKSTELRDQLSRIPMSQMVLETDSPYLTPSNLQGRRNAPRNLRHVASFLADLLGADLARIAEVTTANAEALFGELESAFGELESA